MVSETRLRWRPFRLPLRAAFRSALPGAAGVLHVREGLLLAIEDGESCGWGEVAPVPLAGVPTISTLVAMLATNADALVADIESAPAALRCGLESALLDLEGRRLGLPIAALLDADIAEPAETVAVNAIIDMNAVAPAEVATAGRAAVEDGFTTLKLKLGVEGLAVDLARVSALREACPGVHIRLDVNGAWALDMGRLALERLAMLEIELIEQPLAPHEIPALVRLRQSSQIPLAADEALAQPGMAERLLEMRAIDVLVLKAAVLGGVRSAARLAARARVAGVRSFVTTTVDSSLGTALALQLAAAIDGDTLRYGGVALAHGLSTGLALEYDLVSSPLLPERGAMALPASPGLGVEPDEAAIENCATGPWSEPITFRELPTLTVAAAMPAGGSDATWTRAG